MYFVAGHVILFFQLCEKCLKFTRHFHIKYEFGLLLSEKRKNLQQTALLTSKIAFKYESSLQNFEQVKIFRRMLYVKFLKCNKQGNELALSQFLPVHIYFV